MANKLTVKQERYKNARISGVDPSAAYDIAYDHKMSRNAVNVAAQKLERHPIISLLIDKGREKATEGAVMSRQEALEKLSLSARVSIKDVADFKLAEVGKDDNNEPIYQTVWVIKNSEDIAPEVAVCIKSITITKTGPKLELHDQHSAIKQLSDLEGWNAPTKHQVEVLDITERLNRGRDRVKAST